MSVDAVFFDLGGVILRTEHQAPRQHLAERLGLSYEELTRLVFDGETARQASLGEIQPEQHWDAIGRRLGVRLADVPAMRDEFFAGDILDRELLSFIRSLRPSWKTGLISNAWLDLRDYLRRNDFEDAFDTIVISAEVGLVKPDPAIFLLALDRAEAVAKRSVMIDDFPENVAAASALGMQAVLFRDASTTRAELQRLVG